MPSTLLVLALVLAVLAIIPTRRLAVRGLSPVTTGSYFLLLWLLSLSVVAAPGRPRFLLPVIVVLAILPFVTFREGLDRLLGRQPPEPEPIRPPTRNVTPPEGGPEAPPR